MSIVAVFDATHANIGRLPAGQRYAGYTTGTPDIRWTDTDWKRHPGAVRICQDYGSDRTADVLDDESGAATDTTAAVWVPKAQASFRGATRPGQRWPAIYKSASGITALVNTLITHGIRDGVYLWVADWGKADKAARAQVREAAGPFPIIGIQNHSFGSDDESWMSGDWLANVSQAGPHRHVTDGKTSITGYAASRDMHAGPWLAAQEKLGGKDAADALGDAVPRAGLPWFSN